MTQRLTQARLDEIEDMELPKGKAVVAIAELLDEVHALRAELAGAEERGAARERAAIGAWLYDVFALAATKYHMAPEAVRDAAEAVERGDHVRTGTAAADGGESQP